MSTPYCKTCFISWLCTMQQPRSQGFSLRNWSNAGKWHGPEFEESDFFPFLLIKPIEVVNKQKLTQRIGKKLNFLVVAQRKMKTTMHSKHEPRAGCWISKIWHQRTYQERNKLRKFLQHLIFNHQYEAGWFFLQGTVPFFLYICFSPMLMSSALLVKTAQDVMSEFGRLMFELTLMFMSQLISLLLMLQIR